MNTVGVEKESESEKRSNYAEVCTWGKYKSEFRRFKDHLLYMDIPMEDGDGNQKKQGVLISQN